jgi:hypothetical protein
MNNTKPEVQPETPEVQPEHAQLQFVQVIGEEKGIVTLRVDLINLVRVNPEREIAKALRPYRRRLPQNSLVRQGLSWLTSHPQSTPADASVFAVGNNRLARRIAYWHSKIVQGGVL